MGEHSEKEAAAHALHCGSLAADTLGTLTLRIVMTDFDFLPYSTCRFGAMLCLLSVGNDCGQDRTSLLQLRKLKWKTTGVGPLALETQLAYGNILLSINSTPLMGDVAVQRMSLTSAVKLTPAACHRDWGVPAQLLSKIFMQRTATGRCHSVQTNLVGHRPPGLYC